MPPGHRRMTMATTGRYVYGLIRSPHDMELGNIGLLRDGVLARVFTLRVGSLAAVVSELPIERKILPLRKHIARHHTVLCEVMKTATILPLTFGHVARSEDEIAKALQRNRRSIGAQLDRIDGQVEMGVKVRWDV